MRLVWLAIWCSGCAYISDKHEAWRLDPDQDGVSISDDCDDDDAEVGKERAWYVDQDEDGYGDPNDVTYQCTAPTGHVDNDLDCDDTDPLIRPGAEEVCDSFDNNCDGQTDEGLPALTWHVDADQDGFGDPAVETSVQACEQPDGYVDNDLDCDDGDPTWQERSDVEVPYNGIDDNCDAADADGDNDLDGYWATDYEERVLTGGGIPMSIPPEWEGDCEDFDPAINPGVAEVWYDGIDSDCVGDDDCDLDGDGFQSDEGDFCEPEGVPDCNDMDASVRPGAVEVCSTDYDDDCNGSTNEQDASGCVPFYFDFDGDGYGVDDSRCYCSESGYFGALTADDCDDTDARMNPGAFEIYYDGIDSDCGGDDDYDHDGDGYVPDEFVGLPTEGVTHMPTEDPGDDTGAFPDTGESPEPDDFVPPEDGLPLLPGGDCDDDDATVSPEGVETCSTIADDDCDGSTNEQDVDDCVDVYADVDGDGFGDGTDTECWCEPVPGHDSSVGGDCDDSDDTFFPGAEDAPYDAYDTDCAGDDDFDADGDGYVPLGYGADGDEISRTWTDAAGTSFVLGSGELPEGDCDDFDDTVFPGASDDWYDGTDSDCAGDDDYDADGDGYVPDEYVSLETVGVEGSGGLPGGDCDDRTELIFPGASDDWYDGIDADCAGDDDYDADGDGHVPDEYVSLETSGVEGSGGLLGGDCADSDAARHPSAIETCDTFVDDDCDGDANDLDADACLVFHADWDSDGYGASDDTECRCDVTVTYSTTDASDCDDDDAEVHPGMTETCSTVYDDNCDGETNELDADDCVFFHADTDGDGHGDPSSVECRCEASGIFTEIEGRDCDDTSSDTFPGAAEMESADACRLDADGDGYGHSSPPSGTDPGGDCDDSHASVYLDAPELCDDLDNDCDGVVDDSPIDASEWYVDEDRDGSGAEGSEVVLACDMPMGHVADDLDCDDSDADISPRATESCDEIDSDCDGSLVDTFSDADDDGLPDCIDPPLAAEHAEWVFIGPADSRTGFSLAAGEPGRFYIGAPDPVDGVESVYVLDFPSEGEIVLEDEAERLTSSTDADFGHSLAVIPEIDGSNSLLIGMPGAAGIVRVFDPLDGRSVDPGSADVFWSMDASSGSNCGYEMDVGVSLDEAEVVTLLVGCPGSRDGTHVMVWEGEIDWESDLDAMSYRVGQDVDDSELPGAAVTTADFDGDGILDVVMGAPMDDVCGPGNCGSAYVYMGPISDDSAPLPFDARISGTDRDDLFAHAVQAGDLNNDGYDELLVSSDRGWSAEEHPMTGSVLLFYGEELDGVMSDEDAFESLVGTELNSHTGSDVQLMEDLDGFDEPALLISARRSSSTGEFAGAVYAMRGPWEPGSRSVDDARRLHGSAGANLGYSLLVHDIDGDGQEEVLMGAFGVSTVYGLPASYFFF